MRCSARQYVRRTRPLTVYVLYGGVEAAAAAAADTLQQPHIEATFVKSYTYIRRDMSTTLWLDIFYKHIRTCLLYIAYIHK